MRGHAHNGPNGGSGSDASATKMPPEAAAAPPLLPVALAEVLGQQTAHLHAKHARFRATAAAPCRAPMLTCSSAPVTFCATSVCTAT